LNPFVHQVEIEKILNNLRYLFLYFKSIFKKINLFLFLFYLKFFCVFSDRFDVLISKIIFKNKKYYFDTFSSEKYFEKQPLPHSQKPLNIQNIFLGHQKQSFKIIYILYMYLCK